MAAVAVVLLAAVGGLFALRPWRRVEPPIPPVIPASNVRRGTVDLLVLRKNAQGQDDLLSLIDVRALPLRTGDRFRIEAEVDAPAYLYLFWIDALGCTEPMSPWREWDEIGQRLDQSPATHISLPKIASKGFNFETAVTGLCTLVLLARSEPLTEPAAEVRGLVREPSAVQPAAARLENYRAWFDDFRLRTGDTLRAPKFDTVDLDLPSIRSQDELQQRLTGKAVLVRCVTFATRDSKGE